MSSVLATEMDAYQRAFAAYKRKAQSYNGSIMKDANGNTYLFDPSGAMNPAGFYASGVPQQANVSPEIANKVTGVVGSTRDNPSGYFGLTKTDDGRYALARTRAQGFETKTLSDVVKNPNGTYAVRSYDAEGGTIYTPLDPNKVEIAAVPKKRPRDEQLYTATYQTPTTFAAKPDEFTMQAPTATQAQGRRLTEGSLADQERGLIGEVMASKGVRY